MSRKHVSLSGTAFTFAYSLLEPSLSNTPTNYRLLRKISTCLETARCEHYFVTPENVIANNMERMLKAKAVASQD
jgi:hypothetical protein